MRIGCGGLRASTGSYRALEVLASAPGATRSYRRTGPSVVVRRVADAMLPARLGDLCAHLDHFEGRLDLARTETRCPHAETPLTGTLYTRLVVVFEAASERRPLQRWFSSKA